MDGLGTPIVQPVTEDLNVAIGYKHILKHWSEILNSASILASFHFIQT